MMHRALIIEDSPADVSQSAAILRKMGVKDIQSISTVSFAIEALKNVADGRTVPPDVVILDLEFGTESGFEVLRYWKSTPQLRDLRIIVWTVMGELEQKIAALFQVAGVVDKLAGPRELERALKALGRSSSQSERKAPLPGHLKRERPLPGKNKATRD